VREVSEPGAAAALCGADPWCRWALRAGGRTAASRVFAAPGDAAVAVAAPDLSGRDRVAVGGRPDAARELVRAVLAEVGAAYRPLGAREVLRRVADGPGPLRLVADFGWMACDRPPAAAGGAGVGWLPPGPATADAVDALLAVAYPGSYAHGRGPADARWAGVRGADGALRAVAALAWSAPDVGFLAGVAVHPAARGTGLGSRVCGFVAAEAVARYGAAGLMVDDANAAAVRCYRSLGFGYRPLAAALTCGAGGAERKTGRSAGWDADRPEGGTSILALLRRKHPFRY
jgi:ribosomal protein S18 acetylase RimI-like enzyme